MFWVKGKFIDFVVTCIWQRYPRFSKQHYWTKSITACYLGMKIHSVLGVSDQFFQQKRPFDNVQLWSHFVTTFLLVLEVFLLHCIKLPEKLSSTLEFKTNIFSIPIHKWVHFYFSKHYFMAVRKHKYHNKWTHQICHNGGNMIRRVPWFNVKLFVILLGKSAKLCIYTI